MIITAITPQQAAGNYQVREFNDIDHITPIVWKMRRDNYAVAVYCLNPEYDLQSDYRLLFLKQLVYRS